MVCGLAIKRIRTYLNLNINKSLFVSETTLISFFQERLKQCGYNISTKWCWKLCLRFRNENSTRPKTSV